VDIPLAFVKDGWFPGTIRCGARNEELNWSTRATRRGVAGVNASVVEAESALRAVAVESMAITAERCLFRIIIANYYIVVGR